ncbi:hypothetical protein BYT27DRAFT_7248192 [Phlegmacium glaucopus]|nr:hypothetical protein BYT27DRAFT_7248192 [Phlegmacium glaucopus]
MFRFHKAAKGKQLQRLAGSSVLSDENADPDNWEWKDESRAIWQPAEKNWQHFCAKWYGATESQSASLIDPKSPSLSLEPLPHRLDPSISPSIFICGSYVMMFDTVWAKEMVSQGRHRVILTGQPGTGA